MSANQINTVRYESRGPILREKTRIRSNGQGSDPAKSPNQIQPRARIRSRGGPNQIQEEGPNQIHTRVCIRCSNKLTSSGCAGDDPLKFMTPQPPTAMTGYGELGCDYGAGVLKHLINALVFPALDSYGFWTSYPNTLYIHRASGHHVLTPYEF